MSDITPKVDIAFKKLFGVEENKDLLISLINSIVSKEDQVADLEILNPYNPANFRNDKLSILDIKAKGIDGKRFNIEIQITDEADYDKRALYYWAKLYTEQLKKGDNYKILSKAIGIHILQFTSILGTDKYHNVFRIIEKDTGMDYFKDLELHTIELKKFLPSHDEGLSNIVKRIKSTLDKWLIFITDNGLLDKDNLPKELDNEHIKKALSVLELMNFNKKEREIYEGHLKWMMIEENTLIKAEEKGLAKGIEEGIARGLEEGIAKGLEKGIEEGIAKGKIEEKLALAKKMLMKNRPFEEITEFTELTEQEIKNLIK